jgi:hypothetical protein
MEAAMKTITLRNIPDRLAKQIEERARRSRKSLNQTVIEIIEDRVAPTKPQIHHDLDDFFGVWSDEEAAEFDAFLKEHRRIDPEDWK